MKLKIRSLFQSKLNHIAENEEKWLLFQNACTMILLGASAFVMSILNFITKQGGFAWLTLIFVVLCGFDLLLLCRKGIPAKIGVVLFAVEVTAICIYFVITGIPDGFSVIWTAMLPSFGLLLFKIRFGSVVSLLMFFVLVFFFWTPVGKGILLYDYNPTFMTRFPILYLAFFMIALLLEKLREVFFTAMKESRQKYEFLCYHDALTGLYNRSWFQTIQNDPEPYLRKVSAVAIVDIDNFKFINDNFGHPNGDIVIRDIGKAITDALQTGGDLCRWGGDEFLILFFDGAQAHEMSERIIEIIRSLDFIFDEERFSTTISVGLVTIKNHSQADISELLHEVDKNLYLAKDEGKNCMIETSIGE